MLRNAIRYWNLIPKHIRQAFVDDGWKLIITNKSLENMYGYSFSIIGITVYDDKTICVEARENAIRRALCHEVGHYWDYKQNWASYESEFEEIYNREKYTFNEQYKADNHCISSPVEFYAEIFAQSLMYPETAYPSAPDSCNYIWKN